MLPIVKWVPPPLRHLGAKTPRAHTSTAKISRHSLGGGIARIAAGTTLAAGGGVTIVLNSATLCYTRDVQHCEGLKGDGDGSSLQRWLVIGGFAGANVGGRSMDGNTGERG